MKWEIIHLTLQVCPFNFKANIFRVADFSMTFSFPHYQTMWVPAETIQTTFPWRKRKIISELSNTQSGKCQQLKLISGNKDHKIHIVQFIFIVVFIQSERQYSNTWRNTSVNYMRFVLHVNSMNSCRIKITILIPTTCIYVPHWQKNNQLWASYQLHIFSPLSQWDGFFPQIQSTPLKQYVLDPNKIFV